MKVGCDNLHHKLLRAYRQFEENEACASQLGAVGRSRAGQLTSAFRHRFF
jgi:hypothetical protein